MEETPLPLHPDPIASVLVFGVVLFGGHVVLRSIPHTPSPIEGTSPERCSSCALQQKAIPTPLEIRLASRPTPEVLRRSGPSATDGGGVLIVLRDANSDHIADVRAGIVVAQRSGKRPRIEVPASAGEFWRTRLGDLLLERPNALVTVTTPAPGAAPFAVYRASPEGFRRVMGPESEPLPSLVFRAVHKDEESKGGGERR